MLYYFIGIGNVFSFIWGTGYVWRRIFVAFESFPPEIIPRCIYFLFASLSLDILWFFFNFRTVRPNFLSLERQREV